MMSKLFNKLPSPPFVFHEAYSCPWPEKHRFPMQKFHLLRETLINGGIFMGKFHRPPHPLETLNGLDPIYLAHDYYYIQRFCENKLTKEEQRKIGLDFNEHLVYRTLSEVGGTLHASDLALEYGMAVTGAGGTHHAHYDYGSGFTIINDLAVTAKHLVENKKVKSVLIFDCDVHQGDGTATICASDNRIFTVSIHCENNFPFVKAISNIDVSLPLGIRDAEYLKILQETFQKSLQLSKPEFVLYDAGADISEHDLLGKMKISDKGIYERDFFILKSCFEKKIPVCAVIGGGYDTNIMRLVARHSLLYRAAINAWNSST